MENWEQWMEMAREAEKAALACKRQGHRRSAVNRAYYAVYQAGTAAIHQAGRLQPPVIQGQKREAWQHEKTPRILKSELNDRVHDTLKLKQWISELYKLRIQADYVGSTVSFNNNAAMNQAITNMGQFLKVIRKILPQET